LSRYGELGTIGADQLDARRKLPAVPSAQARSAHAIPTAWAPRASGTTRASSWSAATASYCRRHLKTWLALTSCRRATIDTDAPGSRVSATICRFTASGQRLRRPAVTSSLVSTKEQVDTSPAPSLIRAG